MSEKPHFHGHRQRLRDRFEKGGADALADYELLELVLFQSIPRGDVKPRAKALIDRFGSFADALSADPVQIREVSGIGEGTISSLKVFHAASLRLLQGRILDRPVISSWQALLDYCQASMGYHDREQFRILFLDVKNVLIADEIQQQGTINHTPVYPREVITRALALSASAIILVHNHPSGDPTPSNADIEITKEIVEAGRPLGVSVHDHVIVGRGEHLSFKSVGLL